MIPIPLLKKQVEQHPYPLLFATISGAHLYGFPSPDSDFDLRGVHLLPLQEVVGLKTGPGDRREVGRSTTGWNRPGDARRPEVLRPAAAEERLRAGAGALAAGRPHDAGTRGTEGDRRRHASPATTPTTTWASRRTQWKLFEKENRRASSRCSTCTGCC